MGLILRDEDYFSATRIKRFQRCPKESDLPDGPQTEPMLAGDIRHYAIQRYYQVPGSSLPTLAQLHPKFASLSESSRDDVLAGLTAAHLKDGFLPPRDWVLSCEGSHLPTGCTTMRHGRRMFQIQIGSDWGLRGAADLVVVDPIDPFTLVLIDWKGRTQEHYETQAQVYSVAYGRMFPDFKYYRFESRHLPMAVIGSSFLYEANDLMYVEMHLQHEITKIRVARATKNFPPRRNEWCHTCQARGDCEAYNAALVPVVPANLDAKTCPLPAKTFAERVELKERAEQVEKIAKKVKDRCTVALMQDLADGPLTDGDKEYFISEVGRTYMLNETAAKELLQQLDVPIASVSKIHVPSYRMAVERRLEQIGVAELRARYSEMYSKSLTKVYTPQIRNRRARA